MKVLFDHSLPFALAHGGFQIQIEQTKRGLEQVGAGVEFVRWWDDRQTGDLIHYFGRPSGGYIDFAHQKGLPVVMSELLTGLGSRPLAARVMQKTCMRLAQALLPASFIGKLAWDSYRKADAFIANTEWEAHLMRSMFDADPAKVHILVNGVEEVFFQPHIGGPWLVCTAAIHPRKRVLELARAAAQARVPLWIIGKPYSEADAYYRDFIAFQRQNAEWIRYEGPVSDRAQLAQIYATARAFVLLSTMETLSLSSFEAAAAGCPLLLSNLPWARTAFGSQATYASVRAGTSELASVLAAFYQAAPSHPSGFIPLRWEKVGASLLSIYQGLIPKQKDPG